WAGTTHPVSFSSGTPDEPPLPDQSPFGHQQNARQARHTCLFSADGQRGQDNSRQCKERHREEKHAGAQPPRLKGTDDAAKKEHRREPHSEEDIVVRCLVGLLGSGQHPGLLLIGTLGCLPFGRSVFRHRKRAHRRIRVVERICLQPCIHCSARLWAKAREREVSQFLVTPESRLTKVVKNTRSIVWSWVAWRVNCVDFRAASSAATRETSALRSKGWTGSRTTPTPSPPAPAASPRQFPTGGSGRCFRRYSVGAAKAKPLPAAPFLPMDRPWRSFDEPNAP